MKTDDDIKQGVLDQQQKKFELKKEIEVADATIAWYRARCHHTNAVKERINFCDVCGKKLREASNVDPY